MALYTEPGTEPGTECSLEVATQYGLQDRLAWAAGSSRAAVDNQWKGTVAGGEVHHRLAADSLGNLAGRNRMSDAVAAKKEFGVVLAVEQVLCSPAEAGTS